MISNYLRAGKVLTDLAQLHRAVLFGQSGHKIIWQPRIGCWYSDKEFAGQPLPYPYEGMSLPELYRSLNCSARLYEFNACFKKIEHPAVVRTEQTLNDSDTEIIIDTPVGRQITVQRRFVSNPHIVKLKWEVETEEELKVAAWREEYTDWEFDRSLFNQLQAEMGDLGAPTIYMPRMSVQSLYIDKMGVENGVFAIYDWPDTTEAYFRALDGSHDRLIEVINDSPVNIVNLGENVHSGTLSPNLFLKYHLPACQHRCERLHAAGKFVSAHWDGDCGPLLQYAQETGLDGIEAITPKPQGDVTLEQIKTGLGDKMFLIDGIPAIYFDETFSTDVLCECTKKIIELFAPKLVLGISDEISSSGDIERIRLVGEIVDEYNSRV